MTDNSGVIHTATSDALGRLIQSKHEKAGAATLTEAMSYDSWSNALGRPSSAGNGAFSYAWTWNGQGLIESKTQLVGAASLAMQYGYDTEGQLTSMTYPSGMAVGYAWASGRISSVSVNGQILISNIGYRASTGEPVSWSWASGSYLKTFDANGKIIGVSDSGVITQTTAFDGALRLTSLTDSAAGSFSLTPTYATGDQIASVNANGSSSSYLFDSNWNRTKRATPSLVDTISMTTQTNLPYQVVTAPGSTKPVTYDSNNNVANNGRGAFVYDLKNNLAQATVNSVVTTYLYDMSSRRLSKTVGGVKSLFFYDDAGNLAGEYSATGVASAEHIYLGDLPIGVSAGGSVKSVHTDYLGTPRVITNGSTVVWKWDASDPFGSNTPSIAQIAYNPRFAGQYYDAETGLHYNHYRTYDPQMGRYMQPDPLGLAAGKNPFNYVNQNPLNGTDPQGLAPYGLKSGPNGMEWDFSINAPDNPVRQMWESAGRKLKELKPRGPDYIAISGNFYVFSAGGAVNLCDGSLYAQASATRSYPNYSYKPSGSLVFGNLLYTDVDAHRVNNFLDGGAIQFSAFLPIPNSRVGLGGSFVHAYAGDPHQVGPDGLPVHKYGGDNAIEYGIGAVGGGWSPISYGKKVN